MARALTGGELSKLRANNQYTRLYLGVHPVQEVFKARVNGTPASTDELASFTYAAGSFESGYTETVADMLVFVGTSDGAYDKGMARLREAVSSATGTIKIGEISEIDVEDDDYVTVIDDIPLAPRHLRLTGGAVYMDYDVAYTDQHENFEPFLVCGPDTVVWLTDVSALLYPIGDNPALNVPIGAGSYLIGDPAFATAYADVDFDASNSWVIGGTITAYSWSAPSALLITGGSTATPTFRFPNDRTAHRVSCTITASNGKTFTGHRYVLVYGQTDDFPIRDFILDQCEGAFDNGGWSFRVTLYADADRSEIRDRAKVILFARDFYGSVEGSIGPITDREHLIALGWISGETIHWDKETGSVSFQVQGPAHWMGQMAGFPSGLEDTSSTPAAWTDVQGLNMRQALAHFTRWRCTLSKIVDVDITTDARKFAVFNAGGQMSLWGQIQAEAQATLMAQALCDRVGRFYCYVKQLFLPSASRSAIPTVHAVLAQDLRRPMEFERIVSPPVGQVDLSGIIYTNPTTANPVFSLAHGHIFQWHGPEISGITNLALTDQAQSNTLSGLVLANRNNVYPSLPFSMASNHRMLDIAPHQWFTHSLVAGDTIRGISWTDKKFVPLGIMLTHDPATGVLLTDVTSEMATDETDVLTIDGDIPTTPPNSGSAPSPPPAWSPLPTDPDLGTGEVLGVAGEGGFFWSSDALDASPTYAAYNTGIVDSSNVVSLCNDPKLPYRGALIDNGGDLHVSSNWRAGSAWTTSPGLTNAAAETLIEATISDTITNLELTCVRAFAKATDDTGTLVVVVQFDWDDTGGENAAQIKKTRVLRSIDWGATWTCGGEIPGFIYLAFTYMSWTLEVKDNSASNHGEGELAFDGTNLIIAARSMRNNSLAASGFNYSPDWGATWQLAAITAQGGAGSNVVGPTAADTDSNGKLYMSWWKKDSGTPDKHDLVSTVDLSTVSTVKNMTDGDSYADRRGMFEILYDDSWAALIKDSADTDLEVNGSAQGSITGDIFRQMLGFRHDDDIIYVGRSYATGEKASGGDEDLLRVSQNKGVTFGADGTNLYALGLRGVTGLVSDWSSD